MTAALHPATRERLLVTGGTGLIGREVLRLLAAAGADVHALAHRRPVAEELRAAATWHEADLLDRTATAATVERIAPTGLLHLAWPVTSASLDDGIHREFLAASQALLTAFHEAGGHRAVVAGTCFEYDWSQGICHEDTTPKRPNTEYGACKDALRQWLQQSAAAADRSWAWGRIFFVYGPHQDRTRFVPALIEGLLNRRPVPCTEGRQVRDYLHAADVASGLLALYRSDWRGACNLGSGRHTTLREIASEIAALTGGGELLQFGAKPMPPKEPPVIVADVSRLHTRIGWSPRFTLAEGLADTVAAWRRPAAAVALT